MRIVPRAGADALEATVHDGRGAVTAVFLGRRRIAGLVAGPPHHARRRRHRVDGRERVMYNPVYTLS